MFDTHCHLNFKRYKNNLPEVIARAQDGGVELMVVPGTDVKSSIKACEIARENIGIYAAVGIHPHHAYHYLKQKNNPQIEQDIEAQMHEDLKIIEKLLAEKHVVAVGEVGMDRHTYEETVYAEYSVSEDFLRTQRELLKLQIELAIKHKKSLVIHNREAKQDLLALLSRVWDDSLVGRAVFHCCEADYDLLTFAKDHKIYIGVDGDVTYDEEKQLFIQNVPFEMLVIETDSPYILPEPLKSERKYPNEPVNVHLVAKKVADVKDVSIDRVMEQTTINGKRLFNIA